MASCPAVTHMLTAGKHTEIIMITAYPLKPNEKIKQIGPRIPESVANALRDYCAKHRTDQNKLVEHTLRDYLRKAGYDV